MKLVKLCVQLIVFLLIFCVPSLSRGGMVNEKTPDFMLRDINGKAVSLKDLHGKVVFVDFWASWCPPCKKEFPGSIES